MSWVLSVPTGLYSVIEWLRHWTPAPAVECHGAIHQSRKNVRGVALTVAELYTIVNNRNKGGAYDSPDPREHDAHDL